MKRKLSWSSMRSIAISLASTLNPPKMSSTRLREWEEYLLRPNLLLL